MHYTPHILYMTTAKARQYSKLPSVITTITRPYCNYGNYDTALSLCDLSTNVTVITVVMRPDCKHDSYKPPNPDRSRDADHTS